jgi:NifB/MoaA-like Fe-S oxidoreductase
MYIKAGRRLPENGFYEGYPQLENGVGMMRLFRREFESAMRRRIRRGEPAWRGFGAGRFTVATGRAAGGYISDMVREAGDAFNEIRGDVVEIRNDFFGESVDVAGLVTGGDIIAQLDGRPLGERLLIPGVMLRRGENVFLDGVSLEQLARRLGVRVRVVGQDGADLLRALLGVDRAGRDGLTGGTGSAERR